VAELGAVAVLPGALGFTGQFNLVSVAVAFVVGWLSAGLLVGVLYRAFSPRPLSAGPLALGAALTGSFLSGMSLTWLFLLRFGVDVGIAFGGSDLLGTVIVAAVFLYLVQVVLLGGYVLTLVLAGGSVGPVVPGHPVDQLAQDVDVAGVAGRLLDHVDQDPAHRHRLAEPGHAGLLEPDLVDDPVGRGPGPVVEGQDVGGRLVGLDP
jgi:MFS family permease